MSEKYPISEALSFIEGFDEDADELWAADDGDLAEEEMAAVVLRREVLSLTAQLAERDARIKKLRRALDDLKIRGYDIGDRELHDLALAALQEKQT